jgi:hypothetical protein
VERLIQMAHEALKEARAAAAEAARAVAEARARTEVDERTWSDRARHFATGIDRAHDLDQQAAHLRTLRVRADASMRGLERCMAEERKCAAVVVKAAMEHRKLELWRDRIAEGEREEESRRERRSSDELAARAARTRP